MSSPIEQNNIDLQAILDTINSLPEASTGGANTETCTVTCMNEGMVELMAYTTISNGVCEAVVLDTFGLSEELTVVKGSIIVVVCPNGTMKCDISGNISKRTVNAIYMYIHIFTVSGDGSFRVYSDIEVE